MTFAASINSSTGTSAGFAGAKSLAISALFAGALAASPCAFGASGPDFNNDGFADIAIGTPFAAGSSGIVQAALGSNAGLWPSPQTTLHQDVPGVQGKSRPGDEFGMAIAWGDFDNDGFDDLAVGVPNGRVGKILKAGCVLVFPGGAGGVSAAGSQIWHQNRPGVPDVAAKNEMFGWALAAGDFNSDGYDDLAIGVPRERIGFNPRAGAVIVLNGSASGLRAAGSKFLNQDSPFVPGIARTDDLFGLTLTTGDFNGDGDDDLAIAAPEDDLGTTSPGSITVLYGSLFGLSGAASQVLHSGNVAAGTGTDNQFGYSLTTGDFNGDNRDELAVGSPFHNSAEGRVTVIPGSAGGLKGNQAVAFSPGASGGGGGAAELHMFGWAVAGGDFDGDGLADLAIGAPLENVLAAQRAGRVHILFGSAGGLDPSTHQVWTQTDIPDAGGVATDEWFGSALASGDFDDNGSDDLVIAAPFEDLGGVQDSGAVIILPGSNSGFDAFNSQVWTQAILGWPATTNEGMGFSLMH